MGITDIWSRNYQRPFKCLGGWRVVCGIFGADMGWLIVKAPEVYDPGGLTLMIDDFCVFDAGLWITVGEALLEAVITKSKQNGAAQVLVVCGHHDELKKKFLEPVGNLIVTGCKQRFSCASLLTYIKYAALRCSETHYFRRVTIKLPTGS